MAIPAEVKQPQEAAAPAAMGFYESYVNNIHNAGVVKLSTHMAFVERLKINNVGQDTDGYVATAAKIGTLLVFAIPLFALHGVIVALKAIAEVLKSTPAEKNPLQPEDDAVANAAVADAAAKVQEAAQDLDFIVSDTAVNPLLQVSSEIPPGDYGTAFMKMFFTLLALIILFGVSIWFIRKLIQNRLTRGSGEDLIQIIEKKMISPKTMLYVIEIEGQKVLLAESQLEIRKIQQFGSNSSYPTTFGSSRDPQG